MVDIKLAAVVQLGFYSSTNSDEVKSALEEVYGESGNSYGGVMMGTGRSWKRTAYSVDPGDVDGLSLFRDMTTYIEPDKRHIHDLVTVGWLSKDAIDTIENSDDLQEGENLIRESIESIESFTSEVPSIPEGENGSRPTVFYVEPTEEIDLNFTDEGLDIEGTRQWLTDHQDFLRRINILLGHHISLIGTEDFISPHSSGAVRQVTMLNRSSTYDTEKDVQRDPIWLRRIRNQLKSVYRSDCWLNHRRIEIDKFDRKTHGVDEILTGDRTDLEFYQNKEREIEELRQEWIDSYTQIADEITELSSEIDSTDEDEYLVKREIVIPPPAAVIRESQPIFEAYDEHNRSLTEALENDIERIGDKLDRVSKFIHDTITARATETNIELQERVKILTERLTWLTILLAVLAVIQIVIAVV